MADTKRNYEFLDATYQKLFEFYQTGKLCNISWIVGPDGGKEVIRAHASICCMSNKLREVLDTQVNIIDIREPIHVPPSITISVDEFRKFLSFAYTGDLDPDVPLQTYLKIFDKFDMSTGIVTFISVIADLLNQFNMTEVVTNDAISGINSIILEILSSERMEGLRELVINFFAFHPFLLSCT